MNAVGGVTATIQLANHVYKWKVFVAPIRDQILLRLDFMKFINVIIFTGQGDVAINGDRITRTRHSWWQSTDANSYIKVDNNIITPATSNEIFPGIVVNLLPNRNSSQKSIPYSDCLKLYSSDEFPGWSNLIRKKIADTHLATLKETSATRNAVGTQKDDASLVPSIGQQRTSVTCSPVVRGVASLFPSKGP